MKIASVNSNPNFGMAIEVPHPYSAEKLRKSITSDKEIKQFKKLLKSQEKNKFNINLTYVTRDGKEGLKGYIFDGRSFYKETTELNNSPLAYTPLKFIEEICKEADKIAENAKNKIKQSEFLFKRKK